MRTFKSEHKLQCPWIHFY